VADWRGGAINFNSRPLHRLLIDDHNQPDDDHDDDDDHYHYHHYHHQHDEYNDVPSNDDDNLNDHGRWPDHYHHQHDDSSAGALDVLRTEYAAQDVCWMQFRPSHDYFDG
jgi:hypothetical protein